MGRRRDTTPFELTIERLGRKGLGMGEHNGKPWGVRFAPPGAVVEVRPAGRRRKLRLGRRLRMITPPPGGVTPRCGQFGRCGGCGLQELPLAVQRGHKHIQLQAILAPLDGVRVRDITGAPAAYAYRNKVELTYGVKRYLDDEAFAAGDPFGGRFLGFHAPERFDRIVETPRCELVSEGLNEVIAAAQAHLASSELEPWDARNHTGFWRHLVLRETVTGERLVTLYSAPPPDGADALVQAWADALPDVTGVVWMVNPGTGDAAIGERRAVLRGRPWIEERLGPLRFQLSPTSFFQTNTPGAVVLYDLVAEAAGAGTRLLDLYCGTGTIALWLAANFDEVVGIELNAEAVEDARENAVKNGVSGTRFEAGPVEDIATGLTADVVVVDPPRSGLHPRVAKWLAGLTTADRLVYVACQPRSLERDRVLLEAGGWRMTDLWTVDMFPQTGHCEAVARFVKDSAGPVQG
jgi:23S rRNA (uracil1939-C5)-methyltransferase